MIHIITNIKPVKIPYVVENPVNIFRYLENINDTIFNATEPISAPGI